MSCQTNYKCYREILYHEEDDYEEIRLGCLEQIGLMVNLDGVCNGSLDTSNSKLRCCDDQHFCNKDLSVSLDVEQPSTGEFRYKRLGLVFNCICVIARAASH